MNRDDLQPQSETDGAPNGAPSLGERVRSLRLKAGDGERPRIAWVPWTCCGVCLALVVLFAYYAYRVAPSKAAAPGDDPAASATASGDVVLESKGYVVAAHQFKLSPQTGGEIVLLDPDFKEGQLYKKGALLARVDPSLPQAHVDSAAATLLDAEISLVILEGRWFKPGSRTAELEQARHQLASAAATLKYQEDQLRIQVDAGRSATEEEKTKTRNDLLKSQADFAVANRALAALERRTETDKGQARARIAKARADLADATKQLQNCDIRAPVNGTVLSKNAELGAYVSPLAFGAAGYLCEMADLSDLEIELDIQERDISRVRAGQRCRIMPEAYQRDPNFLKGHPNGYDGVVSRVMPQANRAKGAITVRVQVLLPSSEPPASYMRPDMGVLVSFLK